MNEIYKNEALIELTNGTYYIHDSTVSRFDIYEQNHQLCIDVYFNSGNIKYNNERQLKIHFEDIIKYQFLYNNNHNFYNVESYKFFKSEMGFYISLDPFNESKDVSEDDEDLILCKNMEGTFI